MKYLLLLSTVLFSSAINAQDFELREEYREQIKELAANQLIKDAFSYIVALEEQTIADHILLTEIEAPPFKEHVRAAAFRQMMSSIGVDSIWTDDAGNVIALIKGGEGNRTVCIDAHLDTVFPEGTDVHVRIKNDTLFAPGIGDDTRGLAILLTLVKTIKKQAVRMRDDVLVIASVGEEGLGDLSGVKHLFREGGPRIDSWISIDGGEIGRVNNQGLGSYRYRVRFKGPGGHSWGAFGLVNPHHALGDAMNRFVERADEYTKTGPRTSYNVGVISGGTSVNSIPFESIMEIDMRSIEPSRLDSMETLLKMSVNEALENQNKRKRRGADLDVDFIQIGNRPSGELSPDLPLIQRALAATAFLGKRPRLTRGSTNANIPISRNIPAVTIGRGGVGAYGHSLNEWWLNKDGYKAIQLAFLLLVSEAGLDNSLVD